MSAGLDAESLDLAIETLHDFAKQRLPDEVLLEFDERDEMPLELVREMCGPDLGLQLLFVPEEYGGMDGILAYADAAASALADQRVSEVVFGEAAIERLGEVASEVRVAVEIPFLAANAGATRPINVQGNAQTFDEVQDAMNQRWRTEIAGPLGIPTQYDAMLPAKAGQQRWVRFWHRPAASFAPEGAGAGRTTRRLPGFSQADIHVPWGSGERDVLALADSIDDAFRMSSYKSIACRPVAVGAGRRAGGEWMRAVRIPWVVDTTAGGGFGDNAFGGGPFGG